MTDGRTTHDQWFINITFDPWRKASIRVISMGVVLHQSGHPFRDGKSHGLFAIHIPSSTKLITSVSGSYRSRVRTRDFLRNGRLHTRSAGASGVLKSRELLTSMTSDCMTIRRVSTLDDRVKRRQSHSNQYQDQCSCFSPVTTEVCVLLGNGWKDRFQNQVLKDRRSYSRHPCCLGKTPKPPTWQATSVGYTTLLCSYWILSLFATTAESLSLLNCNWYVDKDAFVESAWSFWGNVGKQALERATPQPLHVFRSFTE